MISKLQLSSLHQVTLIEKCVIGKITEGPFVYKTNYFSDFVRLLYNSCLLDLKSIWIQPHSEMHCYLVWSTNQALYSPLEASVLGQKS